MTGLDAPQSECSDAKGNVWVDVTDAHQIIKLSHNGKIRKTLTDPRIPCRMRCRPGNRRSRRRERAQF